MYTEDTYTYVLWYIFFYCKISITRVYCMNITLPLPDNTFQHPFKPIIIEHPYTSSINCFLDYNKMLFLRVILYTLTVLNVLNLIEDFIVCMIYTYVYVAWTDIIISKLNESILKYILYSLKSFVLKSSHC